MQNSHAACWLHILDENRWSSKRSVQLNHVLSYCIAAYIDRVSPWSTALSISTPAVKIHHCLVMPKAAIKTDQINSHQI